MYSCLYNGRHCFSVLHLFLLSIDKLFLYDRLAAENQARIVAEEQSRGLNNKYNFDRTAACEVSYFSFLRINDQI